MLIELTTVRTMVYPKLYIFLLNIANKIGNFLFLIQEFISGLFFLPTNDFVGLEKSRQSLTHTFPFSLEVTSNYTLFIQFIALLSGVSLENTSEEIYLEKNSFYMLTVF